LPLIRNVSCFGNDLKRLISHMKGEVDSGYHEGVRVEFNN
jgi:hypothetical protein